MAIVLYDLVGTQDRRFSPNCWRTRMALAHKGLECEARPTRFTEITSIADRKQKTVPVIEDGERIVGDSWAIAEYLEATYRDRPSLFRGEDAHRLTLFVQSWVNSVLHPGLIRMILRDIYDHLTPEDKDYFRRTREQRFGARLEAVQADREERLGPFRASLQPLRSAVASQPYLGGDQPAYADYLVFGAFQWARVVSPFHILAQDDPIRGWFRRCLNLHGGLGLSTSGYDGPLPPQEANGAG